MAGFVDCHRVLLLGEEGIRGVPAAEKNPVPRLVDVSGEDDVPVITDGDDGRLVDEIGQIRSREPGVARATLSKSTSGARRLPSTCTARMAARSAWLGRGISTSRSKRPGRSRAGSSTSGRLVAAMTTTPVVGSKPSISARSWLRVCPRSSLETIEPPRRWPMASTSSMKMMDGARLRASAKRSRTRDAPTPTNSSTKLDPLRAKKGTPASPATARA